MIGTPGEVAGILIWEMGHERGEKYARKIAALTCDAATAMVYGDAADVIRQKRETLRRDCLEGHHDLGTIPR